MDFGKVLGRAWKITWRWKVLWVLGFLAALGQGTGSGGAPDINYTLTEGDLQRFGYRLGVEELNLLAGISALVIGLICLAIIVAILLWVISVIARGSLIAAVQQVETEGSTSFGKAWAAGARKFWTLFGLGVLAALPMIVLIIFGLIVLTLGYMMGFGLMDTSESAGITTIIAITFICGGFLCCGMVILALGLEQIRVYAERAAILENLGWIEAFRRGWQVLVENIGATLILWLIFFALGIAIFTISFLIMGVIFLPLIGIIAVSETDWGWLVVPLCLGGVVGTLVYALIRSIVIAYTSATWTLAYRELTGQEGHPQLDNLELIAEG